MWTGLRTCLVSPSFASDRSALLQALGELFGDQPVAARVGVDRVGLQAPVLEHLADDALFVGHAEFLRDAGIERRRRDAEARLRRADEQDADAAAARELHHLTHVVLGLRVAQPAQKVVAADAQQHELWRVLVERARQARERLRRDLAGHAGAYHAPADQLLELRRVALVLGRAGAVGQAVAEGEYHRVARQALQFGALAAAEQQQGDDSPAQGLHFGAKCYTLPQTATAAEERGK